MLDMLRTTALTGPQFRLLSLAGQKGGAAQGYQAAVSGIVKKNGDGAPYCIPNEYICATIGRFIGLPIPPAGVVYMRPDVAGPDMKGEPPYWFASLDFNIQGDTLPPVDGGKCVAELPYLSAGLLLFDILVANGDRHNTNLSVDFMAQPAKMSVFDHSHALLGYRRGDGKQRLVAQRDELAIDRHCLLQHIATDVHFAEWRKRIQAIPDFFIEDAVHHVQGLGMTSDEGVAVLEFLEHRRDHIADLISAHKNAFTSLKQWSLL